MAGPQSLDDILQYEGKHPNPRVNFLRKLILCLQCDLRVNGQAPDDRFSLYDHLACADNFYLDLSKLSKANKKKLQTWLILNHRSQMSQEFARDHLLEESHLHSKEKKLGFFERLRHSRLFSNHFYKMSLPRSKSHPDDDLFVDILNGKNSIGIHFSHTSQNAASLSVPSYEDSDATRNALRVQIHDEDVNRLLQTDLNAIDFSKRLSKPHPQAIRVLDQARRVNNMLNHRQSHGFLEKPQKGLFKTIGDGLRAAWNFITGQTPPAPIAPKRTPPKLKAFVGKEDDAIQVKINPNTFSVLVTEKRPSIDAIAFCGGGAKIFAHIGALKEFRKQGIYPKRFTGSSAGAIMAVLSYLGYNCDEIENNFSWFDRDKLMDFNVGFDGLSTTSEMRRGLNFFIMKKVIDIIQRPQYNDIFFNNKLNRAFLDKHVFNKKGIITFSTLDWIKRRCQETGIDCELGEELIVTGTNTHQQKTEYYSFQNTPDMAVAQAVEISACLPVAFRPIYRNGEALRDGGILNNFPIDSFEKKKTFLQQEDDANYGVVGFHFDNGVEEDVLYSNNEIYRESAALNKYYSLLTGVSDPASGWYRDRENLRKYSQQSILLKTGQVSVSNFSLPKEKREALIKNGMDAAHDYLESRYILSEDKPAQCDELLYKTFESPEELLNYCVLRKNWELLAKLKQEISTSDYFQHNEGYRQFLVEKAERLIKAHAPKEEGLPLELAVSAYDEPVAIDPSQTKALSSSMSYHYDLGDSSAKVFQRSPEELRIYLFVSLYPLLMLNQKWEMICPDSNIGEYIKATRGQLEIHKANQAVDGLCQQLQKIEKGHFLIFVLRAVLSHVDQRDILEISVSLGHIKRLIESKEGLTLLQSDEFYGRWTFEPEHASNILHNLMSQNFMEVKKLLNLDHQKMILPPLTAIHDKSQSSVPHERPLKIESGENVGPLLIH